VNNVARQRQLFKFYNECGEKHPGSKIIYKWEAAKKRERFLSQILRGNYHDLTLDLGCCDGYYRKYIPNYVGLDIAVGYLERFKGNRVWSIAQQLPFADGVFDRILMSEVLEHIYERKDVLNECYRILKEKGHLIISTPYGKTGQFKIRTWWKALEPYDIAYCPYVHGSFSEPYMRKLLTDSKFKIERVQKIGQTPEKPKAIYIVAVATKRGK